MKRNLIDAARAYGTAKLMWGAALDSQSKAQQAERHASDILEKARQALYEAQRELQAAAIENMA